MLTRIIMLFINENSNIKAPKITDFHSITVANELIVIESSTIRFCLSRLFYKKIPKKQQTGLQSVHAKNRMFALF